MPARRRLPLRALMICLTAGALINVAIAWACALRLDPVQAMLAPIDQTDARSIAPDDLSRLRGHPYAQRFSDAEVWLGVERQPSVERRAAFVTQYWQAAASRAQAQPQPSHLINELQTRVRAGWPALALHGERWIDLDAARAWNSGVTTPTRISDLYQHRWMLAPTLWGEPRMTIGTNSATAQPSPHLLPLRPMWPGFLINTALYAIIVWLLLFAPFACRRASRRRRNLCERCAYPRGASNVCSECGSTFA